MTDENIFFVSNLIIGTYKGGINDIYSILFGNFAVDKSELYLNFNAMAELNHYFRWVRQGVLLRSLLLVTVSLCFSFSFSAEVLVSGNAGIRGMDNYIINEAIKVQGTVIDVNGEPIIGATIQVKGTSNATITNADGWFEINVAEKSVIVVSYVGFQIQEITIGAQKSLKIILKEDNELLDEVVVVGYGSVKKSDLTGAVSSVSNEILLRGGKASAVASMQGTVPGVTIVRTRNKPGSSYDINIRGLASISGSTAPLIVVDGMPGADLENINPDDIEKIDILKDASSTAIYGSRATNGVVIVTTKKGAIGKPQITYNGYVGVKTYTNMPDFMDGDEFVQYIRESYRASKGNGEYIPDGQIFTDPSELKAVEEHKYFDWVDALSSPAMITNHTITASGGTEMARYSFSGGYYFEDGMIDTQNYTRYNLKSTVDIAPNDKVKFGGSLYLTHSIQERGNGNVLVDMTRMRPTQHPVDLLTGETVYRFPGNNMMNPLTTLDNEAYTTKVINVLANVYLAITPIKGLELKSSFSPNLIANQIGSFYDVWSKEMGGGANGGKGSYDKNNYTNWVWDNMISYQWKKDIHNLNLMGVFSLQQNQTEELGGAVKDLKYASLWYNMAGGAMTSLNSKYIQTNLMSYLGRISYNLMDKYLLTASLRYDGSSRLADGNKWSLFPSVAMAWRLSEEAFMRADWLSNLKLRVSYGQTGNDNVDAYQTEGILSGSKYASFGSSNVIGYTPGNLRNLELGWERTNEYNIGLDYGLFNNRISGSIEYYNRLTKDLIMSKMLPIHLGYSSVKDNVGSVRNQGVEFIINSENMRTEDFSWRTTFSLAYNKNEIVDLDYKEDLGTYASQLTGKLGDFKNKWVIGEPITANLVLESDGIWQLGDEEEAAKYGQKPGQYKVKDYNSDYVINDKDMIIYGQRTPKVTGGFTNTFAYKNFDLAVHAYYSFGAKEVGYFIENNSPGKETFTPLNMNYWTPENPSNECAQPGNVGPHSGGVGVVSKLGKYSRQCMNTNFVKVAYITLGYTFSKKKIASCLNRLRIYATVQNPFTFTSFKGIDPEYPSGWPGNTDFMTSNWTFGVNVSF